MFFSLNKKILYSLLAFLLVVAGLFFLIFINLYSQKLQDSQNNIYMRNQYVVDLLYDNINLQKQLIEIAEKNPHIARDYDLSTSDSFDEALSKLTTEQKVNAELKKNYNKNYEAVIAGGKMMGFGFLTVIAFILALIFLLDRWVIKPIEKMTYISHQVSAGVFSSRIVDDKTSLFNDEFNILYTTFNQMLENIEQNIEAAKLREKFLQQLIDAIPEGIRVIDQNYNVVMANKALYEVLQLKDSCIGKKCYEAYGYKCEQCPESKYNCPLKYLQQNQHNSLYSIHEVGKIPLYVSAARLKFVKENEDYVIEAFHDLSGDVRFSHQQKVSSLAFLSTSVAHEMKNNLGAIRLILEGLLNSDYKDIPDDDERKKYLLMAYNQLVETVKIPERLLKMAQYSENEMSEVDVGAAIKDMMLMVDYEAKRKGVNIVLDVEPNISFMGNEADFKMIILNLSQNAIKAMPDGGELRISAEKNNRHIIVNVKDTGTGIDEEKIKHIFEPFYSANTRVKSSGLGLAIVNSLMTKAHGSIVVKSKINKGTRFSLRFPQNKKI